VESRAPQCDILGHAARSVEGREAMFKVSGAIRSTSTADGAVLLDIHRGKILSLNRMGARILRMLEGGLDQDQIAGEISKDCGVDASQVRNDVLDFVQTLRQHKVLEASGSD
jgi:hypothetical protein